MQCKYFIITVDASPEPDSF